MAPHPFHSHDAEAAKDNAQTLTTILATTEERASLTSLITQCTSSMRKTITDTFDPRFSGLASDAHFDNPGKQDATLTEEELQKQRDDAAERIKELSEPEMQELKSAALKFFDEWREKVLARVAEALAIKGEASVRKEETLSSGATPKAPEAKDVKVDQASLDFKDVKANDDTVSKAVNEIYAPIQTPLVNMTEAQRRLILHCLMLLLLSLQSYSAHSRILMLYVTSSLKLSADILTQDEDNVAQGLLNAVDAMNADKETEHKAEAHSSSRKWKVGLAAAAGAALIGVTGGLAAPLLAAGVGTVMGGLGLAETAVAGYLGAVAGSTLLIGSLFGAYGGHMTGKMMDDYAKEVEDFAFLPIHRFKPRLLKQEPQKLRVAVGISGWLSDKEEVIKPWRVLSSTTEGYALRYEMEALLKLGNALTTLLKSTAWAYAKKEIWRRTIFIALKEAFWPLYLLKVAKLVDNPFSVAKARSDKAGEVLADALINKVQGERPVTLIGYSLGARVIYTCLQRLAERKAFGLVENVVLLGLPATSESADWRKMRAVVAGRLVNVYSENDYILAFLYRTSSIRLGVAGLQKAEFVRGVESVDATDIVSGHLRYRYLTGAILKRIGFEDIDLNEVEHEEDELKTMEQLEEREAKEKEKKYGKDGKPADQEADDMEKEVAKKNEQSMMDWATSKLQLGTEKANALWDSLSEKKDAKKSEAKAAA